MDANMRLLAESSMKQSHDFSGPCTDSATRAARKNCHIAVCFVCCTVALLVAIKKVCTKNMFVAHGGNKKRFALQYCCFISDAKGTISW